MYEVFLYVVRSYLSKLNAHSRRDSPRLLHHHKFRRVFQDDVSPVRHSVAVRATVGAKLHRARGGLAVCSRCARKVRRYINFVRHNARRSRKFAIKRAPAASANRDDVRTIALGEAYFRITAT